jgi:hypothetical protein
VEVTVVACIKLLDSFDTAVCWKSVDSVAKMNGPSPESTKRDYAEFLAARESLLPWIAGYSPCALVSGGDPPVCLFQDEKPKHQ